MTEADYDDELVSSSPAERRNWRGIFIAMLVIACVLALIVTSVVLLTPPDPGPRLTRTRLSLAHVVSHDFTPLRFNGSWISGDEMIMRDEWNNIIRYSAVNLSSHIIMSNSTYRRVNAVKISLSPDHKYLLLAHNIQKLFRHSFLAQYSIYDIASENLYTLMVSIDGEEEPFLLHAEWAPRGHALLMVYNYDIYYRSNPRTGSAYRVSKTAVPGIIFNGVPDWLYEEEILGDGKALWMSSDSHMLLYASFNDSEVEEFKFPWYGVGQDTQQLYPQIRSLRYPKPGTKNPKVTLYVADLADPKNIRTRDLKPPMSLMSKDHYFVSVSWVSSTEVGVIWMNRAQNTSVDSLCKSPVWFCQEIRKTSGEGRGWVEPPGAPIFSPDGNTYLTMSPIRDGAAGHFRHVVAVNIPKKGDLPLTHGKFDVVRIVAWDTLNQLVYYLAVPEGKPGEIHLYRAKSGPGQDRTQVCLSCSAPDKSNTTQGLCGYHNAIFSPGCKYYVLECLGPGLPSVHLYSATGPTHLALLQNNTALWEKVSKVALPDVRTFPVEISGGFQARVRLFLPPVLREDEITQYPLLLQVYGGPGSQLVTEKWRIDWASYMASSRDTIVVQIDGRGTSGRGYDLMHQVYRRLGTVEVADQLEVTEYLRDRFHYIDKKRVGVWGWSYGGFVAAMLLSHKHQDIFQCGISVAPITSWRLHDSAYTERYLGEVNGSGWGEESELGRRVEGLRDKQIYLVHGTADDRVHLQHGLHLARALSARGIVYTQQVYPDENHSLAGVRLHLYRSMSRFLDDCFNKNNLKATQEAENPL